jgi:hypothetical protein
MKVFTRFNLTDKEKSAMSTREVIKYLKAKKEWIDNKYSGSKMTQNKGNQQGFTKEEKLLKRVFNTRMTRTLGDVVKKQRLRPVRTRVAQSRAFDRSK